MTFGSGERESIQRNAKLEDGGVKEDRKFSKLGEVYVGRNTMKGHICA